MEQTKQDDDKSNETNRNPYIPDVNQLPDINDGVRTNGEKKDKNLINFEDDRGDK